MLQQPTREEWIEIVKQLAAPFPAEDIELRYDRPGKYTQGQSGAVLAYVTARAVQDRLDEVAPGAWQFTYDVIAQGAKDIEVVKGRLEVYGLIREDVGDAPNLEKNKGAVSDALKRAAVQFGIGRYLYKLPKTSAKADGEGHISADAAAKWAAAYNRRFGLTSEAAPIVEDIAAAPVAESAAPAAPVDGDAMTFTEAPQAHAPAEPKPTQEKPAPKQPAKQPGRNELGVPTGGMQDLFAYGQEIGLTPKGWNDIATQCRREPDAIRAHFNHMKRTALEGKAHAGKGAA